MIPKKATDPNEKYQLGLSAAFDEEGNPIPVSEFHFGEPVSNNTASVEVVGFDPETNQVELKWGVTNEDGTASVATVEASVFDSENNEVGKIADVWTVSHGKAARVEGGFTAVAAPPVEEAPPGEGSPGTDAGAVVTDEETPGA